MNNLRGILIILVTLISSLLFLPVYLIIRSDRFFFGVARLWARVMCWIGGVRVQTQQQRTPNGQEPCIYVCNHRSLFDIPSILSGIDDDIRLMYKAELRRIPFFGWVLALSPFVAVNRADAKDAVASLDKAARQIGEGASVLIFAEGTWSTTREVLPFKRGGVVLAVRSGKNLVPVALSGTESIVPPDTYSFRMGVVRILVGDTIVCPPLSTRAEEKQFTEELRSKVVELVRELEG